MVIELVTPDGRTAVIDHALACGPHDGRRVPHRGALTRTTAPETATAILTAPADTLHPRGNEEQPPPEKRPPSSRR